MIMEQELEYAEAKLAFAEPTFINHAAGGKDKQVSLSKAELGGRRKFKVRVRGPINEKSIKKGSYQDTPGARIIRSQLRKRRIVIKRMLATARKIVKYPHSYSQESFGHKSYKPRKQTPCGTVACIAGQYAMVAGGKLSSSRDLYILGRRIMLPSKLATDDLKLDGLPYHGKRDQEVYSGIRVDEILVNMFRGSGQHWPSPFDEYENDATNLSSRYVSQALANIAAARICHFVKYGQ